MLAKLIVVAMDENQDRARAQCDRMLTLIRKVDDVKLSGRLVTKRWLNQIHESIGNKPRGTESDTLKLTGLEGEWFRSRGGGRRLRIRGLLKHTGTAQDIKSVSCDSTVSMTLRDATDSRSVSDSLCHVDYFPAGAQVTFSSEAAIVVGRDEMRHGVASVLLSIQVSGKLESGDITGTAISEMPVPPPTERSAFKIEPKKAPDADKN